MVTMEGIELLKEFAIKNNLKVVNWWIYKKGLFTYDICIVDYFNENFKSYEIFKRENLIKKYKYIRFQIIPNDSDYVLTTLRIKKKNFYLFKEAFKKLFNSMILTGNEDYEDICLMFKLNLFIMHIFEKEGEKEN